MCGSGVQIGMLMIIIYQVLFIIQKGQIQVSTRYLEGDLGTTINHTVELLIEITKNLNIAFMISASVLLFPSKKTLKKPRDTEIGELWVGRFYEKSCLMMD